jgi:acyl-CoA hydrolase
VSPSVGIGALLIEEAKSEHAREPSKQFNTVFAKSDDDSSSPAPMREETNHTLSERRYRRAADRRSEKRTRPRTEQAIQ